MNYRHAALILCAGFIPQTASAQSLDWVYNAFSAGGSPYNASNHSIPQGAGISTPGVPQPPPVQQQMYIPGTNMPFQNQPSYQPPQNYQYNVPVQRYPQQQQRPLGLNQNLYTQQYHMEPPPPPPPVYRYVPPRQTYVPPQNTFSAPTYRRR